jgi:hypothetical protein
MGFWLRRLKGQMSALSSRCKNALSISSIGLLMAAVLSGCGLQLPIDTSNLLGGEAVAEQVSNGYGKVLPDGYKLKNVECAVANETEAQCSATVETPDAHIKVIGIAATIDKNTHLVVWVPSENF